MERSAASVNSVRDESMNREISRSVDVVIDSDSDDAEEVRPHNVWIHAIQGEAQLIRTISVYSMDNREHELLKCMAPSSERESPINQMEDLRMDTDAK